MKRVAPQAHCPALRRRLVYRARADNAVWSHRVFRLARALRMPGLYLLRARAALATYQGLTWSRGRLGRPRTAPREATACRAEPAGVRMARPG